MRMLRRCLAIVPLLALGTIVIGVPTAAFGRDDARHFATRLIGFNETPASINTEGVGTVKLTLNADSIDFELNYRNVRANPTQSHIHFGQARTSGAVVVFFCGPPSSPAKQPCPESNSGTVRGTLTAADVIAVPAQGIAAGDLKAIMRAIRGGAAYANLHTTRFPGGEIRGQLQPAGDRQGNDDSTTDNLDAGD